MINNIFGTNNTFAAELVSNIWRYEHQLQWTPVEGYEPADTVVNEKEIREIVHGIWGITDPDTVANLY